MRFRDILLEYDRSKTLAAYRSKLLSRMGDGREWMNLRRTEPLQSIRHPDVITDDMLLSTMMSRFENADTTPNKKNVRWIAAMYASHKLRSLEDLYRLRQALTKLEILKDYGYFKKEPGIKWAAMADLSKGHRLTDIETFISTIDEDEFESQAERDRKNAVLMAGEEQADILYNDDKWKIVIPKTTLAASFYGKNTKWCTTSENGGMFEHYSNMGPLYIVLDKPNNRRWQFHFETAQFMDERDDPVFFKDLPPVWDLIAWSFDKLPTDYFMAFVVQVPSCATTACENATRDQLIFVMYHRVLYPDDVAYTACREALVDKFAARAFANRTVIAGDDDFTRASLNLPYHRYDKEVGALADAATWAITSASVTDISVNAIAHGHDIGGVTFHRQVDHSYGILPAFEMRYGSSFIRARPLRAGFLFQIDNEQAVDYTAPAMRDLLQNPNEIAKRLGLPSGEVLREGFEVLMSQLKIWKPIVR